MNSEGSGLPIPPSIRAALGWDAPYSTFNREERNVAAILYHLLLTGDNLTRFCDKIGAPLDRDPSRVEMYVEFAYLRDLWHALQVASLASQALGVARGQRHDKDLVAANAVRRKLILDSLHPSAEADLAECSTIAFNRHFGAARASSRYIQSPGRWTVIGLAKRLTDDAEFLRTCRFKWAFNIKPDLVVIDQAARAVCVEAKVESGEGSYPTSELEREEFDRRFGAGQGRVGQLELQRQLMENLLGFETTFVYLVQDLPGGAADSAAITMSWKDAFGALDCEGCQPYMKKWITRL
jgi:hypothetical protein